jgi:hypothetical protein
VGTNIIVGVLLMRMTLVVGLVLLVWAPERRAGSAGAYRWRVGPRRQRDDHPYGRRRAGDLPIMGLLATGPVRPAAGVVGMCWSPPRWQ